MVLPREKTAMQTARQEGWCATTTARRSVERLFRSCSTTAKWVPGSHAAADGRHALDQFDLALGVVARAFGPAFASLLAPRAVCVKSAPVFASAGARPEPRREGYAPRHL